MTSRSKAFDDPDLCRRLTRRIAELAPSEPVHLMEVCGTHTQAIGQWGIRGLLPGTVRLVSGPGCPVCVTPGDYLDNACRLALEQDVTIATFGDLLRVPGFETSLEEARSRGADIRTVYSAWDSLELAAGTDGEVVFLAIGFETTIAGIAATIKAARSRAVQNLSFYTSLRVVPPALVALVDDPEVAIDGFLLPGHVSVIIGTEPYDVLARRSRPGVVAGFEPVDILHGVEALLEQIDQGRAEVQNLYTRVVKPGGNPVALALFEELFDPCDEVWRGVGVIPSSGYLLKDGLQRFDAARRFDLPPVTDRQTPGCRCGDVLKGKIIPPECPLFGKSCTPNDPVGPCMVSGEGSCAAYYRYE